MGNERLTCTNKPELKPWVRKGEAVQRLYEYENGDAVLVVRCGKCKHCDPENSHCDHPMGTALPVPRKPNDFCSYGERREDVR